MFRLQQTQGTPERVAPQRGARAEPSERVGPAAGPGASRVSRGGDDGPPFSGGQLPSGALSITGGGQTNSRCPRPADIDTAAAASARGVASGRPAPLRGRTVWARRQTGRTDTMGPAQPAGGQPQPGVAHRCRRKNAAPSAAAVSVERDTAPDGRRCRHRARPAGGHPPLQPSRVGSRRAGRPAQPPCLYGQPPPAARRAAAAIKMKGIGRPAAGERAPPPLLNAYRCGGGGCGRRLSDGRRRRADNGACSTGQPDSRAAPGNGPVAAAGPALPLRDARHAAGRT